MTRLPTPGSDAGQWGDILNDYLSRAHKSDGTLKDNIITESNLAQPVIDKLNTTAGPSGPTGATGPEGPTGAQGATGPAGPAATDESVAALITDSESETAGVLSDAFASFADPDDVTVIGPGKINWWGGVPLMEWAPQSGGALWHIVPGPGQTAPYSVGVGLDNEGNKGFVFSLKAQNNFGIALNLETTSGDRSIGGIVQVFGPGKGMEFRHGGATAGHLLVLKTSGTATGRMLSVRNAADLESGYFDADGRLTLRSTSANHHQTTWNFGSGPAQRSYVYTGEVGGVSQFWTTYIDHRTDVNRMRFRQSRAAAAQGAESLTEMMAFVEGKYVSLFGRSPESTGGDLTIHIANATTAPTAAPPTGGGIMYVNGGDFRWLNPAGHTIALTRQPAIANPTGGSTVDAEARAAISALLNALRPGQIGLLAS